MMYVKRKVGFQVESPKVDVREFPTNAFMQEPNIAIQLHVDNLVATFGEDKVREVLADYFSHIELV